MLNSETFRATILGAISRQRYWNRVMLDLEIIYPFYPTGHIIGNRLQHHGGQSEYCRLWFGNSLRYRPSLTTELMKLFCTISMHITFASSWINLLSPPNLTYVERKQRDFQTQKSMKIWNQLIHYGSAPHSRNKSPDWCHRSSGKLVMKRLWSIDQAKESELHENRQPEPRLKQIFKST